MKPEIEEFARLLMQHVRDEAIESCDNCLDPEATHVKAQRWKQRIQDNDAAGLANVLIPDCVDSVLFYLMNAIDQGLLDLSFKASNGNLVNLSIDGGSELAGWCIGTDAWREAYSKCRFADDFKDVG